jgi:alkyl hydroperoxide reductase subunit D
MFSMSIAEIKDSLPAYAKDLKLNLGTLFSNPGMTDQQVYGTALACAYASRNAKLLRAVAAEATENCPPRRSKPPRGQPRSWA